LAGLAEHLRNLLVAHSLGAEALEEVAESTRALYAEEAERFGEADLLRLLSIAGDAEADIKNSPQPRLKLETTLLKMAQLRRAADLNAVLEKIDRLEEMAEAGTIPLAKPEDTEEKTTPADPAPEAAAKAKDAVEPASSYGSDEAGTPPATPPQEENEPPEEPEPEASSQDEADESRSDDTRDADAKRHEDGHSEDAPPGDDDPSVEYDDLFGTPALEQDPDPSQEQKETDDSTSDTAADGRGTSNPTNGTGGSLRAQATVAEPASDPSGASGIAQVWPQLVQAVKDDRISLGALLGETEPVEFTDSVLTVSVPRSLHRDTLRDQQRVLIEHLTATVDAEIHDVQFVVDDAPAATDGSKEDSEPTSPREKLQALRDTYPALDVLFGEFGAEPVW